MIGLCYSYFQKTSISGAFEVNLLTKCTWLSVALTNGSYTFRSKSSAPFKSQLGPPDVLFVFQCIVHSNQRQPKTREHRKAVSRFRGFEIRSRGDMKVSSCMHVFCSKVRVKYVYHLLTWFILVGKGYTTAYTLIYHMVQMYYMK